ncbi:tRNA (adenosine(37)-N6)-threonylcarbamoyltransferase complex transferase subunit TsaD [Gammaproteobacteria bacterium]|jgi:N6-L-threonylcarbamoyladenine synthase|nr:tRNA (adenosine(37)-N6)-threonylcarbamoyltransferase complex transferase subunit TsaD [Gammaproteobacteria bacterium]
MITLGIETSCDETALAIHDSDKGIISESVFSQEIHAAYGGVVPELASRDHCSKIIGMLHNVESDCPIDKIDQIAYTSGPGLVGALLVGENFAQGLSFSLGVPLININHLEAHLHAPKIDPSIDLDYPFITLLVSGGHTMIVQVNNLGDYELLGETRDDASGEAFDKVSKLLGLGYPGGPEIQKAAKKGNPSSFSFPRPMIQDKSFDMSFSGLKTAVLYATKEVDKTDKKNICDIAASFQSAITDVLVHKLILSAENKKIDCIVLAGGVAANDELRKKVSEKAKAKNIRTIYPQLKYCTDNAAMIAYLGSLKASDRSYALESKVRARWPLQEC